MFAASEATVEADVDAFLRRGSVNAQDFETLFADRSPSSAGHGERGRQDGWRAALAAAVAAEIDALIIERGRRAGLRGLGAGTASPSSRPRGCGAGTAFQRGPFRPFGFDQSVCLRPDGALRGAPPQDLPHAARAADAGTGLLPLRRRPHGGVSARPGPGYAGHLAVTRHHAPSGIAAAEVSFAKASEWLTALAGVDVETR